jgi:phospholipid-binding lipoprotein MlaA
MKTTTTRSMRLVAVVTLAGLTLGGCATTNSNPRDPLEGFNRGVFAFNDTVDKYALKPVATAYKNVLPSFVQTGVHNFFGNLTDAWSAANNLLQGKGEAGMQDVTRFAINSTFGIAGLIDIAGPAGLPKHNEDLGQTLGYWGMPSGPYLVLPILGPSTLRDTAALPGDWWGDIWTHKTPVSVRNTGTVIKAVDTRASLLDASSLVEGAALDRYEFLRDGFLQRRDSQVRDGGSQSAAASDSGKLDMKAAYGDDAPAAPGTPAAATPVTPVTPAEPSPATPAPVNK